MKRFENRIAKLEKVTKSKPCIWVFVPEADYSDRIDIDTDKLRKIAEKEFGIFDFYLSEFTSNEVSEPQFHFIEDFGALIDHARKHTNRIGEKKR